ncbi:DEAD/DEAH box helicase [Rhodococcus fascians]|uniref:DEAD/DEAH box helicase n=1 Tax=Rhodococcoides fascians TaxID=1828 RepID=UPI00195F4791|nr:DEAD/DEAH box helicase [Rhodococcus fascians]MBM7245183.1 DEAD/DEAH box helicase [Rhodococcus fascians]MBY3811068.1 DEAD/DEAH box helicase [Rhodococcus fascians]MBY3842571.1 DEAD/DEAH box helicase [Rhodococcus fascians]MBY3845480.1 DEAD/DEAH box helicase [Rhodococcus fascians]MBY3851788.1 DEAD/DEAH box helicase [Rhodococcus fascians]
MGVLLPTLQSNNLREGLTNYLATTFALTDPDAQGALSDFVGHADTGMFKGPYARLRLPFASAGGNWRTHLDWWPTKFMPYGHQASAFERLSTKFHPRPQPTLVNTGTGSGKTEAFLYPILDHVLRAKAAGGTGMKALILYPMNALANDQAERLAGIIAESPELSGITAGLYTGEQSTGGRTKVSNEGLITDRSLMHSAPPDILLTNYKMLDHLLLHPDRADIWRLSAESLQYIVLDEFHTYDGAQGTDVAMLLRRLGLTVKAHWTDSSRVTDADRARPLGRITPVATSATLGSKAEPTAMLSFARTVFGEQFDPDAVIGETRLTATEWLSDRDVSLDRLYEPIPPTVAESSARLDEFASGSPSNAALTAAVLAELFQRAEVFEHDELFTTAFDLDSDRRLGLDDVRHLDSVEQLHLLKGHPLLVRLLDSATNAISLADLADTVFDIPAIERDTHRIRMAHQRFLDYLFAALSHLRAEVGRSALGVDVHLWFRELSRIDRSVATITSYRWSDDGVQEDGDVMHLPALYCRHCGRSGWGARLAPTGHALDVTDDSIRADHASGASRFRALISAPAEALLARSTPGEEVEGLHWFRIDDREISDSAPDADSTDELKGKVLPVLVLKGDNVEEESKNDTCPACGVADGIRFLGSAVATQLSVTLSNLFGDVRLDAHEKKALMFTDSVQDAAHRAGFVQARSHTLSLRSTLRSAIGTSTLTLPELSDAVIARAGEDPARRYHLLAPDIVDHDEFQPFWKPDSSSVARNKATAKVRRRLEFDIDLEFGLQSRLGRTLELTGSAVSEVRLGDPGRPAQLGRAAINAAELQMTLSAPDSAAVTRWVRGTVERVRTRGAINHPWLRKYVEKDANRRWVWGGRTKGEGMPAFPKGRPAPAFPAVGSRSVPEGFDAITSAASWFARWASQCLGVSPFDGSFLARSLFSVLAEQRVLTAVLTEGGLTAYALPAAAVIVSAPADDDLAAGRHLLVCSVCQTPTPGSITVVDQLDGAPCLLVRCPGTLARAAKSQNFYRRLYDSSEMKRVVAREHTSLLPTATRLDYETAFKRGGADPQAPNVLVATPTLEMGIDIGDLSTVMLGSLPRTVASYLQRVGRAGRLTGNSLVLAFVRGRGEHLPKLYDPTSVIQGEVRPPATFLTAEEILQRQYIAHVIDRLARDTNTIAPRGARAVLGSFDPGSWMAELLTAVDSNADSLVDEFLAQFDEVLDKQTRESLRTWATSDDGKGSSGLATSLQDAVHRWNRDLTELTARRDTVDAEMDEFERRASSPAATDDDLRDLRTAKGSLRLLGGQIHDLTDDYWISVLERYGVLPNYTLLDDAVTLDVGVTWIDPDTNQYMGEATSYQRGSRIALTELAPGATFYAQGLAARIDAVDLGAGESNIHTWRLCPQCGWAGITLAGEEAPAVTSCPRCGTGAIADVSQQLQVVEMARVSAEVRRDEAAISDARDERHKESFTVVTAADIDPVNVERAWFVDDHEFGAEYLRRIDVRWLNMGRRTSQGGTRTIAGQDTTTGLFRVCSSCGQLDRSAGRNSRYEHRSWCRHRNAATEHVREIALARTLRTQGVLLHLPKSLEYDLFAHPSLSAAILLGLRQVIGGSPEHLDVATITDALYAPSQRALLIHDTVPGGTGYLAEFADPAKVWAVLDAARTVVRNCDCAEHDRLACHKCLLPFAPPHQLDKVSRVTALRVLNDLLDVDDDTEPNREEWVKSVREGPRGKPIGGGESPLEKEFYVAFVKRLCTIGATVRETPGTYGPSATIVLPGRKIRTWKLTPQVHMANSKPDFELATNDSDVPRIALFADGRKFHATPGHNRVADDATKRAILRDSGHLVWSFGHEDLQRFKTSELVQPAWLTESGSSTAMTAGSLRPAIVKQLAADPITTLLAFIRDPDLAAWESVGKWLPMALVRADNRAKGDGGTVTGNAVSLLDGGPVAFGEGSDMCWSHVDGQLAVTAAMLQGSRNIKAVLVVDDRDDKLEIHDGRAWKEWLRLSNWLGLSGNHLVTTRSLIEAGASAPAASPTAELTPEWQAVYDSTVSDAEKRFVIELAATDLPVPTVGFETDDGEVVDFAWRDMRIGVLFASDDDTTNTMSAAGWTLCPPDAGEIAAAIENGVA